MTTASRKSAASAAILFLASCFAFPSAAQQANEPMMQPVEEEPLVLTRGDEEVAQFDIEVADDPSERARGLMFREDLPDDRGMLFIFDQERQAAFWMKNTPKSLDIIFIRKDGEIATIAEDTKPYSLAPIPSQQPVLYVLEINAGLSEELGIEAGDRFRHPLITGSSSN